MSQKYKLPTALDIHFQDDPVLKQLKEDGEEHNRPVSELFKAATAYLLDSRRYLFIELGRYIQQFGKLEPMENETGAMLEEPFGEIAEGEPYNPEEETNLKVLPAPPKEENKKKFTKTYDDQNRS
jgi:hypothetical protein